MLRTTLLSSFVALAGCAASALAGTWELAPSMPAPKANTFAVNYNGAIYMVGGAPWENGGDQDGSVYKFANGLWTTAFPLEGMGPVVGQGGGVDSQNHIIIFGGITTPAGDISPGRSYEPVNGPIAWLPDAPSSNPPLNFGIAVDGQKRIYRLGGGCDNCIFNSGTCSRYDGATNSWTSLAYLPYTRSSIASVYDGLGHIWAWGGYTSFGLPRIGDAIRYTVATDTWENMGTLFLAVPMSDGRAVLGADGRMYIIGGLTGPGAGVTSGTVYVVDPSLPDPLLTTGPSLIVPRYDFGVALGNDNYIYVMGGISSAGTAISTVERLYTGVCPNITGQSPSQNVTIGQNITLTATATGGAPLTYQWKRNGTALVNGATGNGSAISGANTTSMTITGFAAADAGTYTFTATNPCNTASSTGIVLSAPLFGDLNHDGTVNAADLAILLGAWGTSNPAADLDGNGVVNGADLAALLGAWS